VGQKGDTCFGGGDLKASAGGSGKGWSGGTGHFGGGVVVGRGMLGVVLVGRSKKHLQSRPATAGPRKSRPEKRGKLERLHKVKRYKLQRHPGVPKGGGITCRGNWHGVAKIGPGRVAL